MTDLQKAAQYRRNTDRCSGTRPSTSSAAGLALFETLFLISGSAIKAPLPAALRKRTASSMLQNFNGKSVMSMRLSTFFPAGRLKSIIIRNFPLLLETTPKRFTTNSRNGGVENGSTAWLRATSALMDWNKTSENWRADWEFGVWF